MRVPSDAHEKMMSTYQLLQTASLSISTFEHIRTIVKGLHPKIDQKLEICSKALDKLQKMQSADFITLSAEGLPEDTDDKRKRKKALLFFINSLKDLESEIKRIDLEFTKANRSDHPAKNQLTALGRIIGSAKGPLGVITLIALVISGFIFLRSHKTQKPLAPTVSNNSAKTQIIVFNGKQIPLNQLHIGTGHDCDSPHYHAITGSVTALDGTKIQDPGNCAFGKLKEVKVIEVEVNQPNNP